MQLFHNDGKELFLKNFGREIVRMEHVCKTFPGVRALDDMSLTVHEG